MLHELYPVSTDNPLSCGFLYRFVHRFEFVRFSPADIGPIVLKMQSIERNGKTRNSHSPFNKRRKIGRIKSKCRQRNTKRRRAKENVRIKCFTEDREILGFVTRKIRFLDNRKAVRKDS